MNTNEMEANNDHGDVQDLEVNGADERVDGVGGCEDSTDEREDGFETLDVGLLNEVEEALDADVETVEKIIGMVESANLEFFRSPGTEGKAYCMLPDQLGGAVEIDSDRFRSWLRTMVYKVKGKRPKRSTVKLVV